LTVRQQQDLAQLTTGLPINMMEAGVHFPMEVLVNSSANYSLFQESVAINKYAKKK
jgi:hypothetical protein